MDSWTSNKDIKESEIKIYIIKINKKSDNSKIEGKHILFCRENLPMGPDYIPVLTTGIVSSIYIDVIIKINCYVHLHN